MIELKEYQEKAVSKLKTEIENLLNYNNKVCIFKSPTGSGKTIMIAEFLKKLVDKRQDNKDFAFIWIAVNKLHNQSKIKLEQYYEDNQILHCSNFEDLVDKKLNQNEILFFNWQSINKKDNLYIKENEKDNNLDKIIENTKSDNREIILIIDESHHTATSDKSREIISLISPKVTIEVSATPILQGDAIANVDFNDVRGEGMIKSEISINPEINEEKASNKTTDIVIIEQALEKRKELVNSYANEGSNVNPLILIQLPDNRKGMIDRKDDVISILKEKNITVENGKLAIYLSDKEDKVNLANIEKTDNEVEVLIFKQAIALGWDCPRSSILILFRDWQSITFSIQTIGRIMRMPEFKHYNSEELNKGYVFTNLSKVEIAQDIAKDYITIYESKRDKELYKDLKLKSIYLKRQREKTRLSGQFIKMLFKIVEKENTHRKINMAQSILINIILTDGKIGNIDDENSVEGGTEIKTKISNRELQYMFDNLIMRLCYPFSPSDSSGRLKTALFKFFNKKLKIESYSEIQRAILSKNNIQTIIDLVNSAKELYTETFVETLVEQREIIESIWEVPKIITHATNFKEYNYKKSIMKPFYDITDSSLESDFINYLDNNSKIKWWYKNGEVEPKYFAIEYKDTNGLNRSFYPDFIVQFNDGRVGILETKGDLTAGGITKEKAEALHLYIKENKNKKLFGGIVYFKDSSWRLNDNKVYSFDKNILSDWKYLDKEL
ncbi:MAG: DEAD/DEAH box helicase family protein [Candidatus Woesearchaeota archaeon]|jgi:type III restriction enzyme|nr:DEAD/DEAH box helicase family protein [Candidatus Woesearchaeota archaeon]